MTRRQLRDSVVVVTGASSGIGRATAHTLAERGASLVLAARGAESLDAAASECEARGSSVLVLPADVCDEDDVRRLAAAAVARFGRIDAWVHTAAVVAYGRFEDVPSDVFRQVLDTNVHGTVHASRVALRQFRRQGHGTLVLTGSLLGEIATPFMSSYVTSKWAVRGLGRVLSIETRSDDDINVCVVSPGGVDTPAYAQAANFAGRVGRPPPPVDPPEKVARAIVRSIERPKPRRIVGLANLPTRFGFTAAPGVFDTIVTPLMKRGGLSREAVPPHEGNVFAPNVEGDAVHGRWGRHWLRPLGLAAVAGVALVSRRLSPGRAWRTGRKF
jgi:NAD(P)-dependent dehydrogenase (short-subunit alcohol dehydrogenase family)